MNRLQIQKMIRVGSGLIAAILILVGTVVAQAQGAENAGPGLAAALAGIPVGTLNDGEKEGLVLMREEEKLARDVYRALGEKWALRTFLNIEKSERSHMAAVKLLLDRYGLEDPAAGKGAGEFKSEKLQQLHDELIRKGSRSRTDALQVGALIEELDIDDLQRLMSGTDKRDIRLVYGNLLKGSRNHLRSFDRQIRKSGLSYEPRYLTRESYDSIVNGRMEKGLLLP